MRCIFLDGEPRSLVAGHDCRSKTFSAVSKPKRELDGLFDMAAKEVLVFQFGDEDCHDGTHSLPDSLLAIYS